MTAGSAPAEPQPDDPDFDPNETQELTGTAVDEFVAVYQLLGRPTKTRAAFSPADVDAMDLVTVAALLGIRGGTFEAESLDLIAQRLRDAENPDAAGPPG